ncbi:uncharacterized protein LOC131663732 [Phymastichus coffea]|uniref:uncharacterized protein LOC131663732 n=1 Tax=Phymastichus coffea TaxID=108790 RepID=UPI00273A81A8|nr:uncharacterized protein LOC131663732 [Phymastichus coffea]XP_058790301.1 uncharacterized protein LOC131663732 [Phymastichus coffea]XP_058790302.1 uncharacterized protein LOC131663732 [Phymastichus coffea]XP_058790303.1 uncharacterized protein LOC131663732 [Phymastichus coffea]XP_058790304.1 uncharacterized protein LOC131663732 [Phymastichus coffea]
MSADNQLSMTNSINIDQLEYSLVSTAINQDVANENHLQTLGLVVSDGLPKFRLNEPGPSALASSIFQQNNMVIDENEQSFVVLSKPSLESIRNTSWANYIELQEKCASADLTGLISFMSPSEIEENFKKVLEENMKLKETLKQNNTTMKEQFNTITTWQKEVMTVCDTHKQKFIETKELMNRLKKQNDELQEQIAKNQSSETSEVNNIANISIENADSYSLLKKSNYVSIENIPILSNLNTWLAKNRFKQNNEEPSEDEVDLEIKMNIMSEELLQLKLKQSEMQKIMEDVSRQYQTDIALLTQQLDKANKELQANKQKSDEISSSELQILVNECYEKYMELKYLNEIITSLKKQLNNYEEDIFLPVSITLELHDTSEEKQVLQENIDFYNLKLSELRKYFSSQSLQYLRIQQILKESVDIIELFENSNDTFNKDVSEEKIKELKKKLRNYRKNLIDEQLHSINDKQITIKIQKQFQKILFDYNSVLCELELVKNENLKLKTMQDKATEENSQKLIEIEKYLTEEKKGLDNERANLLEEQSNLHAEKKLIIEDKEKIEMERKSLILEKERFAEERISLHEERTSLDQQSRLYEAEKSSMQKEKIYFQKNLERLKKRIKNLTDDLGNVSDTLNLMQSENRKLKDNEELLSAYRIQTEMRERQFEEMRLTQKNLQDQLQALSLVNLRREYEGF